ncbi:pyridoxal-phosphate dependent enzyme [Kitasatospora griseola]|uniref:pyridoxal-phosphate dependent enzyme n=1 Tax=Kitasatospora griseola TaxID=2064 RepID=UPI003806257D
MYDAQRRLRGVAACTPTLTHPALDRAAGRQIAVKAEALQHTGSFKFRGAYNALAALDLASRRRGVVGASSGNHAQALALAGQFLDVQVTVVVPHDAPQPKIDAAHPRSGDRHLPPPVRRHRATPLQLPHHPHVIPLPDVRHGPAPQVSAAVRSRGRAGTRRAGPSEP